MFSAVLEKFLLGNGSSSIMKGGASQLGGGYGNGFFFFLVSLSVLLIKSLLVMVTYNIVVPRILESYSVDLSRYRNLNFGESVLLVILFNNLFSRF